MNAINQEPALADVFPRANEAQWRKASLAALKGAPFDSLISHIGAGIELQPLYARLTEDRPRPWRRAAGAWRVCARVDHPDAETASDLLRADLDNGADAIHFVFAGAAGAYGFGLPTSREALTTVVNSLALDSPPAIEIDLPWRGRACADELARAIEAAHVDPASCRVSFGLDPLGDIARGGGSATPWTAAAPELAALARALAGRGWRGRFALADGRIVAAAGGSPARELAYVLSCALSCWRALEEGEVDTGQALEMIGFRLSVDADQFVSIAKMRAMRRLWARVEQASGFTPTPIHIHAETAWRMMAARAPWNNLLRTTLAIFAAGVGGADAISTLPFTQAIGLPDAAARRLARNSQLLLLEEAHIAQCADPAGGAGGIEALTDTLCATAWRLFQEIERVGGIAGSLAIGAFQADVAADRATQGPRQIIGVTEFPNSEETPVVVLSPLPAAIPLAPGALAAGRDAEASGA